MATITGLTAARMIEIEQASVVDGDVVGDDLILTTKGGSQINAGNVRGPQGAQGPVGSDLAVVSSKPILDVGMFGQIRAGRQLTATDFTSMGLSAPIGLWNLSNLNDSSGNGRNLSNKGSVLFASGIEGVASSAAQFTGSTGQALYIADTGVADPFRIRTGSLGCWFRTAKRAAQQGLVSKYGASNGAYWLQILATNTIQFSISNSGSDSIVANGFSDVCDDRWHFVVVTCDGSFLRVYVDGVLEGMATITNVIFSGSAPLNIGALGADASTAAAYTYWGRVDEAFITADILSDEQVSNLYCVKIPHTLSVVPKNVSLNVRRRKKGAALASGDFPTAPLRLYNFSAGSLNDEGSNGQVLINNGASVAVAGVDGSLGNAYSFIAASSQSLSSTDAGLPSGTAARSIGCWFKSSAGGVTLISYGGAVGSADIRMDLFGNVIRALNGSLALIGPFMGAEGRWHFAVFVQDSTAVDGLKSKLYCDGRLVAADSGNLVSVTLSGANKFRIGSDTAGANFMTGQIDASFVCGYALDAPQIAALYIKGSQALGISPKNFGDHVEMMTSTDLFCVFDTIPSQHQVDLVVA